MLATVAHCWSEYESYDDLTHYQRTLAALAETARLMDVIDDTVTEYGGWPLS